MAGSQAIVPGTKKGLAFCDCQLSAPPCAWGLQCPPPLLWFLTSLASLQHARLPGGCDFQPTT